MMDNASESHQGVDSQKTKRPADDASGVLASAEEVVEGRSHKPPKTEAITKFDPNTDPWQIPFWIEQRTFGWSTVRKRNGTSHSASSDNSCASYITLCDDCIGIDLNNVGFHKYRIGASRRIPLANIERCPMCAFFHAFIVRRGFKISKETEFVFFQDVFERWNIDLVGPHHFPSYDAGSPISIQAAFQEIRRSRRENAGFGARLGSTLCPRVSDIVSDTISDTGAISGSCSEFDNVASPTDWYRTISAPVTDFYPKRRVYPHLQDYRFIANWLDDCVKSHGDHCINSRSDLGLIPGLQFIDCIARRIIPASEVVDKPYLTLSYVWGAPSGTTSENVEENGSASMLPIRLPKVVEDAIRVVRELGFRYLWVDRYCIPQVDKRAKHTQIQLMGTIYARSVITIIAAAGEGAEYGLPGVGLRARNPQLRIDFVSVYNDHRLPRPLMVHHQPNTDIESSLWSTRGWTYQEALLSKRRLVFTDNQVFFQCQHMLCEESQTSSGPVSRQTVNPNNFVFPSPADFKATNSVWARINEFMKRNLSFERDALDAISGILNMYRSESTQDSGVAFLCGMPLFPERRVYPFGSPTAELCEKLKQGSFYNTSVLVEGLLWTGHWGDKDIGLPKAELSLTRIERPRRSEFPSWTWVGWKNTSQYALKVQRKMSRVDHAANCVISAVYEDRQMDLDWEKDAEKILENSALGLNPKFLDIKGTCFDVSLAWRKTGPWDHDPLKSGWVYTKPLAFSLSQWGIRKRNIPPNTLEEGEGKVHKLVALLLTQDRNNMEGFLSMNFLLVQPVQYSAGRWVYERVTSDLVFWDVDERRPANLLRWRQIEAVLEERELRLC